MGSAVVFLDGTVVNVALPAIREDLGSGLAAQQWVVEAYLLTLGALILVGGSLGDLFGRRRIFVVGLAGFGVTSVICAVSPTVELLIAARALQGIAGALLVPSSLAMITATFPDDERGRRSAPGLPGPGSHWSSVRSAAACWSTRPRGAGSSPSTCRSCWRRWRSCTAPSRRASTRSRPAGSTTSAWCCVRSASPGRCSR
jgi:hypothetical protein